MVLSTVSYVLNSSEVTREALGHGPIADVIHFLALGGAGWFWLFIVTLFEDRPISPQTLAPGALLTGLGLIGWIGRQEMSSPVWIGHNLIEAGFALHALFVIANSWRGDLVESRRRLRGPVLAIVTVYVSIRPDGDVLRLRGCAGPFCQTQTWRRLSSIPRPTSP